MSAAMTPDSYLHKAQRALSAAQLLLLNGEVEGACNRAYYAMFDAAQAALYASADSDIEVPAKTHRGLIGAFGLKLVQTGRLSKELGRALNEVEQIRLLADIPTRPSALIRQLGRLNRPKYSCRRFATNSCLRSSLIDARAFFS